MPEPRRVYGHLKSFPRGINSSVDALLLAPDQLSFATNASMRGDFVKQRPSFLNRSLTYDTPQTQADFQSATALFQGATYYRSPTDGYIMLAVGGKLFSISISQNGAVLVSAIIGALPNPNPSIPSVPSSLIATAGDSLVLLSWADALGANSYNVKRSTVIGGPYVTIAATSNTNYSDSTAVNNTTYFYVVSAVNIAGESANSSSVSATPAAPILAPATPQSPSTTSGNSTASIFWSASAGASTYNVKRSTTNGSGYVTIATPSVNAYTDTTVVNGTVYYYVVSAVNSVGESANSTQVSASPVAPPVNIVPVGAMYGVDGYYQLSITAFTSYTMTKGANDIAWAINKPATTWVGAYTNNHPNQQLWLLGTPSTSITAIVTHP